MKTRKWSLGAFPVNGCDPFATMCMFARVREDGRLDFEAFIRIPFSDRPKRGGGKVVPRSWLAESTVFLDVKRSQRSSVLHVEHAANVHAVS